MQCRAVVSGHPRWVASPTNRTMLLVLGVLLLLAFACCLPAGATQCATPTFNPDGGTYSSMQMVFISCSTSGATIHYTTNGLDPTTSDPTVSNMIPVYVMTTETLKAKAWATGYDPSNVKSADYVIGGSPVATPTFSPDGGTYSSSQSVAMSCATSGATIYYTTDGSTPTTSSAVYSTPVTVDHNLTLKAMGVKSGMTNSSVKSANYLMSTTAATPTFNPDGGTYSTSQTVTMSTTTSGASIYYTTNGTTPTRSSSLYSAPISVNSSMTVKAIAVKAGMNDSAVKSADYYIGSTTTATPTFSPDGGTYSTYQMVYITCATTGATIRYTTNGLDPTTSDPAVGNMMPVTVSSTLTLKARAWANGMNPSVVKSALYTIQSPCATPYFSPGGGTYSNTQNVTISSSTSGATIYYTTNGADPTTSSSVYSSPVSVDRNMTLKAMAVKSGMSNSPIGRADYTLKVATPAFNIAGGYYAATQSVTITCATTGATIRYTTDGSTPTSSSAAYSAPVSVADDMALKARAFRTGCTDSDVTSADYYIGMTNRVATPVLTASISAPRYDPFSVQITCATAGAEIRYTEDGTVPSQDKRVLYDPDGRVVIGNRLSPTTVKTRAFKAGMRPSLIASETYTISTSTGGGGTPGDPLYYEQIVDVPVPDVPSITVTEIYEPRTMRVEWPRVSGSTSYEIRRTVDGVATTLGTTSNCYFVDSSSFDLNKTYTYSVRQLGGIGSSMGLPAPPSNADPKNIYNRPQWGAGSWLTAPLVNPIPSQVATQAGQSVAVDSRYDLRRAGNYFLDHQFGAKVYRGGLFVGFANDPSRVGRSFLKVPLTIPTDRRLFAASMNAYHTRSFASSTVNVGLHVLGNDTWDPMSMVWSNAPTIDPTQPVSTVSKSWNSASPVSSWATWPIMTQVCAERQGAGDGVLSLGLASANETGSGWAYFAKPEWNADYAPHVLYAHGASLFPVGLSLASGSVRGGDTVVGSIWLNGQAPAGGCTVSIDSDNPGAAMVVPRQFNVTGNGWGSTFVVSTAIVSSPVTVTLAAGKGSASLTINP